MANDDNGLPRLLAGIGINLGTVIQVATIIAVIYAQWTVLGNDVAEMRDDVAELSKRIDLLSNRMYEAERQASQMEIRWESLRDAMVELRRQSGLRRVDPLGAAPPN